ncbi:hypothetical protein X824_gp149 [Escherichia phage 4MG]|uniref:Hyphothetical protein n=1 Tax=Escherichia phage 4MG TaxID=1391428 RepID=V5KSF6_9CAUD|nr:hypothetical protein X824_gp149 [Escherichia phage 4MG]AGZ17674.1 hyphothetical protein [Escherichia phage 4MG]
MLPPRQFHAVIIHFVGCFVDENTNDNHSEYDFDFSFEMKTILKWKIFCKSAIKSLTQREKCV